MPKPHYPIILLCLLLTGCMCDDGYDGPNYIVVPPKNPMAKMGRDADSIYQVTYQSLSGTKTIYNNRPLQSAPIYLSSDTFLLMIIKHSWGIDTLSFQFKKTAEATSPTPCNPDGFVNFNTSSPKLQKSTFDSVYKFGDDYFLFPL